MELMAVPKKKVIIIFQLFHYTTANMKFESFRV